MDGLLVDTERFYFRSWQEIGQRRNIGITEQMIRDMIGMEESTSREYLCSRLGPDFEYDPFHEEVRNHCIEMVKREGVPLKPFAEDCLRRLFSAGYRLAVATGTKKHIAVEYLQYHELLCYFDVCTFGGEARRGKPFPDVFLITAEKLEVSPATCIVLEDSANGIRAAKTAGMTAVWIPDLLLPKDLPETARTADWIFKDLMDATDWILRTENK